MIVTHETGDRDENAKIEENNILLLRGLAARAASADLIVRAEDSGADDDDAPEVGNHPRAPGGEGIRRGGRRQDRFCYVYYTPRMKPPS